VRRGKHGARSAKQAIAIGLSRKSLARQARSAAKARGRTARQRAAMKAVRTKGARARSQAAQKAARTRLAA
jgi:hypothetical protein